MLGWPPPLQLWTQRDVIVFFLWKIFYFISVLHQFQSRSWSNLGVTFCTEHQYIMSNINILFLELGCVQHTLYLYFSRCVLIQLHTYLFAAINKNKAQKINKSKIKNGFNVLLFGLLIVSRARVVLMVFAKRLLTGPKSQVPLIM